MNLIILAAGSGKRLYPLTRNTPKSLIDLGDGTTLLDRQLVKAVESHALHKVYIITGYLHHMIDQAIIPYQDQIEIETIFNPYFDVSNNLLSLWVAHYMMGHEDFLVSNGDNIYKSHVYDSVIRNTQDGIQLTIDYKDHYDDDDMKVLLGPEKQLQQVSKKIAPEQAHAESVGLVLVKGEYWRKVFRDKLLSMVKVADNRNAFWLELFNNLVSEGNPISTREISIDDWGEVDFHPDIEAMKRAIFKELF